MAPPSPPPPSAALWGGWYANIMEMSTFDTPAEQETFLRQDPLVHVLAKVEATTTMEQIWSVVRSIDEESVMKLNSTLLDDLRKASADRTKPPRLSSIVYLTHSCPATSFCLDRGAGTHTLHEEELRYASRYGLTDIVVLLLDRGSDIHVWEDYPLRWAALGGYTNLCQLLLDRGADIHARYDYALCWAAEAGHKEVVALLLDRGADIHAYSDGALRDATRNGHKEVCELLVSRGAVYP